MSTAKRLRLIIESHDDLLAEAKATHGRRAIVNGVLHRSDTVGEMTPIFMDVINISALK
jgi:hypothetical protein